MRPNSSDACTDETLKTRVSQSISAAAVWEFSLLSPAGTINQTDGSAFDYADIDASMAAAYRIVGNPRFSLGYYWIYYVRDTLPYWIPANDAQMTPVANGTI